MFHIVLYQPEIPANTGNIIRLCANTGAQLHLIHPLGFQLNDKKLRRAGLDYHESVSIKEHDSYAEWITTVKSQRLFACSTKGHVHYHTTAYQIGDAFLFGAETRGLPSDVLTSIAPDQIIRVPMQSRSLNLANTVAIILYEAWRQVNFQGGD